MTEEPIIEINIEFWKRQKGPEEIQLLEAERSSRYTHLDNDMNLIGEFTIDGRFGGTIGVKTESWNIHKNHPAEINLIEYNIFKIFDSENKWAGTLEECIIDEIAQSYKSDPHFVFSVAIEGMDFNFPLIQRPGFYIFPFTVDDKSKDVEFFLIEKKKLSIGSDWNVKRCVTVGYKAAHIDDKWGNKIKISTFDHEVSKNDYFLYYLILFSATLSYQNDMKQRIKEYSKAIKDGLLILHVSDKVLNRYAEKPVKIKRVVERKPKKKQEEKPKISAKNEKKPPDIKKSIENDIKKTSVKRKTRDEEKEEPKDGKREPEQKIEDFGFKIEDPIEEVDGIGKKTGKKLRELGIKTIGDLINANIDELTQGLEDVTWISKSRLEEWQTLCSNNII
ncbi:MAG: hypothetical protein GF329_04510 [Candidatus Lokiarchaeota archaeon]|nr:hypothetical protein [Candidatus Lokiarchaeota archaeon]